MATLDATKGPRAQKLDQIFNASLDHTASVLTPKNMASCFPSVSPAIRDELTKQLGGFMTERAKREYEGILAERDAVPKLNALDAIVDDAAKRKSRSEEIPVAPHTLPPAAIVRAHLAPHYIQAQSKLNAKLQNAQAQNETLINDIKDQRQQVEALLAVLESLVGDLEGVGREVRKEAERQ